VGRVLPGDPNTVRDQPTRSGGVVGQIPGGAEFFVLEGPICADDLLWWRVDYNGLVGWTVQGDGTVPWLEALAPTREPTPERQTINGTDFNAFDVSFSAPDMLFGQIRAEYNTVRYTPPYESNNAAPAYRRYQLDQLAPYAVGGTITVYAVQDMETFYGFVPETILSLEKVLDEAPSPVDLPVRSDEDNFIALADYIQFQNGTGYRYITSVGANYSARHTYRYYGLTSDREFYIELRVGIHLPTGSNGADYRSNVAISDLGTFQAATLNEIVRDPGLVRPSLSQLDALVASINIHAAAQTVIPLTQPTPTSLPPTMTPLPPTQTPVPTATPDGCFITAISDVYLLLGPDVTFEADRVLIAGESIRALQRYTAGGGFFIYRTEEGSFVHEDFTRESPLCTSLPIVEQ
jgi:hypothetical protein